MTENVADYSLISASSLPNTQRDVDCFMQGMTGTVSTATGNCGNSPASTSWTSSFPYSNSSVYDSDFVDPDLRAGGADTYNFDKSGTAVSYFAGHGVCSGGTTQVCTSSSQCTSPPVGAGAGACRYGPPGSLRTPTGMNSTGQGVCAYLTDRYIVTSSANDTFGHFVRYSNVFNSATQYVAFGESSNSGGWRGAGTVGGANLAVLDLSCGALTPWQAQEVTPLFGGLQYIATIMPTTGDTAMVNDRGQKFAHRWQANASEPMANAWTYTLNDLPQTDGSQCSGSNYNLGGGHGINGCGCNFIMSTDTQPRAYQKMKFGNWISLADDTQDGTSTSAYYWFAVCNYDTTTYPLTLP